MPNHPEIEEALNAIVANGTTPSLRNTAFSGPPGNPARRPTSPGRSGAPSIGSAKTLC